MYNEDDLQRLYNQYLIQSRDLEVGDLLPLPSGADFPFTLLNFTAGMKFEKFKVQWNLNESNAKEFMESVNVDAKKNRDKIKIQRDIRHKARNDSSQMKFMKMLVSNPQVDFLEKIVTRFPGTETSIIARYIFDSWIDMFEDRKVNFPEGKWSRSSEIEGLRKNNS